MPLVKGGHIITDEFVRITDDADLPAQGAILVSETRFLAGPDALVSRTGGKLGRTIVTSTISSPISTGWR